MAKEKGASAGTAAKPLTKSQLVKFVAEKNDLTRAQAAGVLDSLEKLMKRELGRKGPGVFNFAGLLKVRVASKPATKARLGVNPFTGQEMMIKAKPARRVVRVSALKKLKSMV